MFVMTAHGTLIGVNQEGRFIHFALDEEKAKATLACIDWDDLVEEAENKYVVGSGNMAGCIVTFSPHGVNIAKDGSFFCAEPNNEVLTPRSHPSAWEEFTFVSGATESPAFPKTPHTAEMARFRARVLDLIQEGKPIKIHCGCGPVPLDGFINLDIIIGSPKFYKNNFNDYFIFPFADMRWDIPNDCIDYVFHEDFIEHIDQTNQFQFLAETLRVMKPGSWHRVNTPNLITAMKYNSDFTKGFDGVYTGERDWEHIAIFSPMSLKEMAETVGYKEVIFTTRNCGVSPYATKDHRPGSDRNEVYGNIYADLMK